jgi:hypothetical protein
VVGFPKFSPPSLGLVPTHFDYSAHRDREIPVDHCPLRQIGYFRTCDFPALTMETHRSSFKGHQPDECLKKGCFARAVRPEQADTRTACQYFARVIVPQTVLPMVSEPSGVSTSLTAVSLSFGPRNLQN